MAQPYISIIVPAYNEAADLPACLVSLQAQSSTLPYEIIVVDNASTDNTAAVAKVHGAQVVYEPNKGVCAARQAGLARARGTVVVSADADSIYPAGWLARIEQCFRMQPDVSLLIGTYRFAGGRWLNSLLHAWERLAVRLQYAFGWQWYVSAANLAYRKDLFDGYDTTLHSGGDELYVLGHLRRKGRVSFDLNNPIITSDRRLRGRFWAVLFHDFGAKYIGAYLFGRFTPVRLSAARQVRKQQSRRAAWRSTVLMLLALLAACTIGAIAIRSVGMLIMHAHISAVGLYGVLALVLGILAYCIFWPGTQLVIPAPTRVRTNRKLVALTFDDGPNAPYTQQIADIIESYDGKASFFQCGACVQRAPAVSARLAAAGHTIGNHTFGHKFWELWNKKRLQASIAQTSQLLEGSIGKPVYFFRSPWLVRTWPLARALKQSGLMPIAGKFISLREVWQPSGQQMARRCLRKIRPGSIIILHDSRETKGGSRTQTVEAVRALCKELAAQGYTFVSLDELFLPGQTGF